MENDLVSVIMPVHNAGLFLAESLESVCRQTYRPLEIVIFDDHSVDDSWEIITTWQELFMTNSIQTNFIQSREEKAMGPGYARNMCVAASGGMYLCHLDADVSHNPEVPADINCNLAGYYGTPQSSG